MQIRQAGEVDRIAAREFSLCTIHGRGHVDDYEIAAKKDGTITGIKLRIVQDLGAYHQLLTAAIPTLSVLMMPGLYRTKNIRADIVGAFTNCVPTDAYRGAGRPEATHGLERMVDMLADELKMDPAEIRLKNFIQPEEFPYPTATGLTYDTGDYAAPLNKALGIVDYQKLLAEQTAARAQGKLMGIGMSTYGEICAFGPSPATPAGGWESATVKIEPSGKSDRDDGRVAARPGRRNHVCADRRSMNSASTSTTSWCCTAIRPSCNTGSERLAAAGRRSAVRRCILRFRI